MTYLSLNQAATETGKSKSTISNALKTGKISYISKDEDGYKIDPAELFRVYPRTDPKPVLVTATEPTQNSREIELLERMNADQKETIADLRRRLDDAQCDARQANEKCTALLEYKPSQEKVQATKRQRWWHKKKQTEAEQS